MSIPDKVMKLKDGKILYDDLRERVEDVKSDVETKYTKPVNGIPAADLAETYLTSETDPTVPTWAKASTKPTYTAAEVGALSDDTVIPSKTSDLTNDSNFVQDASYVHTDSNYTAAEKSKLEGIAAGAEVNVNADWNAASGDAAILNKPTAVSAFANDAGYITDPTVIIDDTAGTGDTDKVWSADKITAEMEDIGVTLIELNIARNGTVTTDAVIADIAQEIKAGKSVWAIGYIATRDEGEPGSSYAPVLLTDIGAIEFLIINFNIGESEILVFGTSMSNMDVWQMQIQTTMMAAAATLEDMPASFTAMRLPISNVGTPVNTTDAATKQYVDNAIIDPTTIIDDTAGAGDTDKVWSADKVLSELSSAGTVQDVQINNTSIVSSGVANIQKASSNNLGVVGIEPQSGVIITSSGKLEINPASTADIKKGENTNKPIVPFKQDVAAFYGLATAAGDSTQSSSSNEVGTYTSEAKTAIQTMLDVPAKSDIPTVPVQDVQVNGTSVVTDGVANISEAVNGGDYGVVKIMSSNGIGRASNGYLYIVTSTDAQVKNGTNTTRPISPSNQHLSTFYGLAKAAGDTTQSQSSNAVGTYTDSAKTAIRTMLGAISEADANSLIATAISGIESFDIEIVQSLPVSNIKEHTIYFVPKTSATNDAYDEYIYINNAWELIGSTEIDLSNYALKSELPTNVSDLTNDANYVASSALASVATSGSYNDLTNKPTIPTLTDLLDDTAGVGDTTVTWSADKIATELASAGSVSDVQINGTSILSSGVANIPVAGENLGLVSISGYGLQITSNNRLATVAASNADIKVGSQTYRPIVPSSQHVATFYGLAKAAGDSTQSQSSNAVGTYTDQAKAAIQSMLGVEPGLKVVRLI